MQSPAIVTVSALVRHLQDLVEENFVDVLVQGELTSLSRPVSGHYYFTLKDHQSQLRCAMFRPSARALKFELQGGMEVICRGRVSIYPQRGDLQLIVEGMEPVGIGGLQLAFQQLKDKLAKEGLFAAERKQTLPGYPAVIGLVTSGTGAAIHDILNVLRRRASGVKVLLRPVPVQGEGAAEKIAEAIADLNFEGSAEVLIVGRGGGSQEDLWAFNEEVVARAIAASGLPVISAVGHEVDVTIADLVADLRAPTPSAAAELVVRNRLDLERHLDQLAQRLASQIRSRLDFLQSCLGGLEKRLRSPRELLLKQREQLNRLEERLQDRMQNILREAGYQLSLLAAQLQALSPLAVLQRGFAIVRLDPEGAILRDPAQICGGERLQLQVEKGLIAAVALERKDGNPGNLEKALTDRDMADDN